MAGLALPIASSYLLSTASQSTSLFYLGHLGADALAAAALGMVFCNVTGFAVLAGLGTGLDTLCSQTATSNTAKPGALGVLLQRGWVLLLFACVPIAFAWGYAGEVLELLGMGKVAKGAGEYCSLARIARELVGKLGLQSIA